MSFNTYIGSVNLAYNVALTSKRELYGLFNYKNNWHYLLEQQMILKALEINDTHEVYTDAQVECLESYLIVPSTRGTKSANLMAPAECCFKPISQTFVATEGQTNFQVTAFSVPDGYKTFIDGIRTEYGHSLVSNVVVFTVGRSAGEVVIISNS